MTEHPILFSGPMVRAILEGRKTQTRRVVRFRKNFDDFRGWVIEGQEDAMRSNGTKYQMVRCPYGRPADRLWVRETWAHLADLRTNDPGVAALGDRAFFRADHPAGLNHDDKPAEDLKWRPSIFMPRTLSRVTLEITNVRVERLHEITEADAIAEGFEPPSGTLFADGWDRINAKRGYSWESNPWVWVIEFKRLTSAGLRDTRD